MAENNRTKRIRGAREKTNFDYQKNQALSDDLVAHFDSSFYDGKAWIVPNDAPHKFFGKNLYYLSLKIGQGRVKLHLTNFTRDELDTFQKFMNHCIDQARPLVDEIDAASVDAHQKGEMTSERLHRRLPTFFTRERGVIRYHTGVPGRLAELVTRNPMLGNGNAGSDRDSDESVVEPEPQRLGTEDDSGEGSGNP